MALLERADGELPLSLPLCTQAELLSLSRSSLYYQARPAADREVQIKRRLDEWYTAHPFLGSRKMTTLLAQDGFVVGRHTIRRYRAEMGLATLYPKPPNLSRGGKSRDESESRIYPYLLRDLVVERPNQVWGQA